MDTRVGMLSVAIASLVTGFFLSQAMGRSATDGADPASAQPTLEDNKTMHVDVAVPVEPAAPARAVPAIQPVVSFRLAAMTAVAAAAGPEDAAEAPQAGNPVRDGEALPEEPAAGEAATAPEASLDYVATLTESGVDVKNGFANLTPGTLTRMTWHAGETLYGSAVPTPVLVAEGVDEGPTLCLTGAVHGDELNGIEIVRRVMYSLDPEKLRGRVVGVPIVNLQGFERHSRYLSDRRDLNRFFPGNPRGSSASRIAYGFFEEVVRRCDALVDLHTGSFHRTNLPQLRANLLDESVLALTEGFGGLVVLHSTGGPGTLRASAVAAGIPAVTLEAGEPLRVDDKAVDHSVRALFTLLDDLEMYNRRSFWGNPEPTYYGSLWVRADKGGMLLGAVKLGKRVKAGDVLGTVTDPITNARQEIRAPRAGRVIGMALNQFVMPGYAAFHLGVEAVSVEELPEGPSSEEVDHSLAAVNDLLDERDDSDE